MNIAENVKLVGGNFLTYNLSDSITPVSYVHTAYAKNVGVGSKGVIDVSYGDTAVAVVAKLLALKAEARAKRERNKELVKMLRS
tara:strand:+ start:185 stop:436 length:252 start_codon:yes stop_codon:yes gene_type:complete